MIVPKAIRRLFPQSSKLLYYKIRYFFLYRGTACYCPVCDHSSSEFIPHVMGGGQWGWENEKCPYCYAFRRHRFAYLYIRDKTDLLSDPRNRTMLHFAPEPALRTVFRKCLGESYRTADMWDPTVNLRVDICNLALPDNSYDVVFCSHVLEHVEDDQKAMREIYRVLKPGGWAIIMIPVAGPVTQEDPTITDKAERERLYGPDHRRAYGTDVEDRLRANGFSVTCTYPKEMCTPEDIARMGLNESDQVYQCTKPA